MAILGLPQLPQLPLTRFAPSQPRLRLWCVLPYFSFSPRHSLTPFSLCTACPEPVEAFLRSSDSAAIPQCPTLTRPSESSNHHSGICSRETTTGGRGSWEQDPTQQFYEPDDEGGGTSGSSTPPTAFYYQPFNSLSTMDPPSAILSHRGPGIRNKHNNNKPPPRSLAPSTWF
jgi:hypothetical protein